MANLANGTYRILMRRASQLGLLCAHASQAENNGLAQDKQRVGAVGNKKMPLITLQPPHLSWDLCILALHMKAAISIQGIMCSLFGGEAQSRGKVGEETSKSPTVWLRNA